MYEQTFDATLFHVKRSKENNAATMLRLQAHGWDLELTLEQVSLLERYAELLSGYELSNVIGTKDYESIMLEHLTDALSCALTGRFTDNEKVIDVGTGGGLPGIPLRIAFPNLSLTLLEATEKKARFLETAVENLGLRMVNVENRRAEDAGATLKYRDTFDVAVARALAPLPTLIEYCAPFVRAGGTIIAMKSQPSSEELDVGTRAAVAVGAELTMVHKVEFLPAMVQKERRLLVFQKVTATPRGFPRRVGHAKQRPLGGEGGR